MADDGIGIGRDDDKAGRGDFSARNNNSKPNIEFDSRRRCSRIICLFRFGRATCWGQATFSLFQAVSPSDLRSGVLFRRSSRSARLCSTCWVSMAPGHQMRSKMSGVSKNREPQCRHKKSSGRLKAVLEYVESACHDCGPDLRSSMRLGFQMHFQAFFNVVASLS